MKKVRGMVVLGVMLAVAVFVSGCKLSDFLAELMSGATNSVNTVVSVITNTPAVVTNTTTIVVTNTPAN